MTESVSAAPRRLLGLCLLGTLPVLFSLISFSAGGLSLPPSHECALRSSLPFRSG